MIEGVNIKGSIMGIFVGMPASLYLEEFGFHVYCAFGEYPYLVGSALQRKDWRDIDVRLMLQDEEYERLGDPRHTDMSGKWHAFVLAFSALGKSMTGLPVDFQIQQQSRANEMFKDEPRCVLGITHYFRCMKMHEEGVH